MRRLAVALLIVLGLAIPTWIQVLPAPTAVGSEFAQDRGDPVLLMWILESVLDDPMTRPEYLLDGNIFHGYDDVSARPLPHLLRPHPLKPTAHESAVVPASLRAPTCGSRLVRRGT